MLSNPRWNFVKERMNWVHFSMCYSHGPFSQYLHYSNSNYDHLQDLQDRNCVTLLFLWRWKEIQNYYTSVYKGGLLGILVQKDKRNLNKPTGLSIMDIHYYILQKFLHTYILLVKATYRLIFHFDCSAKKISPTYVYHCSLQLPEMRF